MQRDEPGSPGEGDQRVLNKYQKNQGASESATATIQAAGADRLRRGQLPHSVAQCAPRLTSVRRGAVQPLWRPATGRVLRLWRTERYRLKDFHALFSALGLKEQLRSQRA